MHMDPAYQRARDQVLELRQYIHDLEREKDHLINDLNYHRSDPEVRQITRAIAYKKHELDVHERNLINFGI